MSEYQEPIKISSNDPICSATSLEGTIIGILFEKKGSEIQNAINKRVVSIDKKIGGLQDSIKDADAFVEAKNKEMEKLDEAYEERSDAKKEHLEPLRRQAKDIDNKLRNEEHGFNKETDKIIAGKAVSFEEGFDKAEKSLSIVDDLIEEKKKKGNVLRSQGFTGVQGLQGSTGYQGDTGSYTTTDSSGTNIYYSSNGNVGVGASNPDDYLITDEEDKAMSRLNTLKWKIRRYMQRIEEIRGWIKNLDEEARRLTLIRDNLNPEREYKLDLNMLSAFGFEDITVV